MTFAQVALFADNLDNTGNAAAEAGGAAIGVMMMGVSLLIAVGMIIAYIMYFLTLSKALQQCSTRARTMEPGMVWLNLIPCFNLVWFFITVTRIAESLRNEFEDRGMRSQGDYGKGIGITTYAILCCAIIPILNYIAFPAYIICWIIYWVKIANLSKQLREDRGDRADSSDRRDDRDDRDDDRPSRRRRDDD